MSYRFSALVVLLSVCCFATTGLARGAAKNNDLTEQMKQSLVYLSISAYSNDRMQPWKPADISQGAGYGCAVGSYQVLTTAWNVRNAAFIKARRYGQNEFIPAKVKVVDYESNLALLELDPNTTPLKAIKFSEKYKEGVALQSYWLSAGGHLTNGRGYLDRADVIRSATSYGQFLNYIVANTSHNVGGARLYCMGAKPIGIACWADGDSQESGLIPAAVINHFLADVRDGDYAGFGAVGFATKTLLDPAMRGRLKMPAKLKHGVYVSKVYSLGTGSDVLKQGDVILAIDSESLNPYGRFLHDDFDRISFTHLITGHNVGDTVIFDIWRDGKSQQLQATVRNFSANRMLVPYHEYDRRPQYVVTAGFVLQKLTRDYLMLWGDDWAGKVSPHLYHYYRDLAFEPNEQRSDIVILSYCLAADINMGYQQLGQLIVSKFNGKQISSIADILEAQKLNPQARYDVIEFEHDYPTVVIDRRQLPAADMLISRNYGIGELVHVER